MPAKSMVLHSDTTSNKAAKLKLSTRFAPAENNSVPPARQSSISIRAKNNDKASDTLQKVLKRLQHDKTRAVDVETTGLDWRRCAIVGYVVTFGPAPQDSYYIPFRHAGIHNVGGQSGLTDPHNWDGKLAPGEKELIKALDEPNTLMFGHNLAFDLKFMSRVGFKMQPRLEDTMINAPLIDELVGRYSLASCAHRHKVQAKKGEAIVAYLRSKFSDIKDDYSAMGHFWRLAGNDPMAVEYAAGDGTTTWQLRNDQMLEITKSTNSTPSMELVHDVESRLIPILARMMVRGIKVDEGRLEELLEFVGGTKQHSNGLIDDLMNQFPSGFNVRSNVDVRAWMEKHGHTDWPMTAASKTFPNGQPSFKEEWLKTTEAGQAVVKVRKYSTLRDSFLLPARDTHLWKGRIHTEFHQLRDDDHGTVTGRLSSSAPNMQAIPKHDEETSKLVRSMFVPDDGKTWGEADYSQMEPRLLAYYSRCKVLLEGYRANPPLDAHTSASMAMHRDWGALSEKEQKAYRNNYGKRINQTLITGGGAGVLVKKYGMDENDVKRKMRDYFSAMPEIKSLQKKAEARFRERGFLLSLLGRRMRLDDPNYAYRGLNRLLQTGNADCLKERMVAIGEFINDRNDVQLLLNCHDAITFQFDEGAKSVYYECLEMMKDFSSEKARIKLDVPIEVDHGEGRNWSEATWGNK